jgi:hypothetical protein
MDTTTDTIRDPGATEANALARVRFEFLEPALLVSADPVERRNRVDFRLLSLRIA